MSTPSPNNALTPQVMLAAAMHAQPGVYAVLLGSGVSTGAGIPTAWGVVQELLRRVAAASNPGDADAAERAAADPEEWWQAHGDGRALGYSSLLTALAPTPATRQGLLAAFFQPTDDDREAGNKIPSDAHHAVAELVKRGTVRVVLTTNFDRLTEQALEAAGVSPQVVARPEAVRGMTPLAHAKATVVKLHGDYADLGLRNTAEELSAYPDDWNKLLDQVFNEFGLIVAGWSADWDTALVAALERSPSRRYPLYWDSRSGKGDTARRLLTLRSGRDSFGNLEPVRVAQMLHMNRVLDANAVNGMLRWSGQQWRYPQSHLLREDLREVLREFFFADVDYKIATDDYEFRTGLVQETTLDSPGAYRAASGEFVGDGAWTFEGDPRAEQRLWRDAEKEGSRSPWWGIGGTEQSLEAALLAYRDILKHYRHY